MEGTAAAAAPSPGSPGAVFLAFLRLGCSAFGGPIAHIGYRREDFVQRRRWLDETQFVQLLAICQFLPGPASSQLGFAIGLLRARWAGALAAFAGFTLPSAVLMAALALLAPQATGAVGAAAVHGLQLVAVIVVAHGLLGMARQLTPDPARVLLALAAAALCWVTGHAGIQLVAIALGGLLGLWLCRHVQAPAAPLFALPYGRRSAALLFGLFLAGLLAALAVPTTASPGAPELAAAFYQSGALVFGGGHVVLPLLEQHLVAPGWLSAESFLAGYGAAQAVPGPLFTLAAFLGASIPLGLPPLAGATMALLAVFLPGLLLLAAALPVWSALTRRTWAGSVMAGINAAVVGLLAAAFIDPIVVHGIRGPADLVIAVTGFACLQWRGARRMLWIVAGCVTASIGLHAWG